MGTARWTTVLALLAPGLALAQGVVIGLCVPDTADTRRAAEQMRPKLGAATVRLLPAAGCETATLGVAVGRFVERSGRVFFSLKWADGAEGRREVAGLRSATGALEELAKSGRLSELSVVIEGLVADHALDMPRTGGGEGAVGLATGPASSDGAPDGARAEGEKDGDAREGKEPKGATRKKPARSTRPGPKEAPQPQGDESSAFAPGITIGSGTSLGATLGTGAEPPVAAGAAVPSAPSAAPTRWPWTIEAHGGASLRQPDVWAGRVAVGVGLGPLLVRGAVSPTRRWSFEGRPVDVLGVSVLAGGRFPLVRAGPFGLAALASLTTEYLTLRRTDVEGAVAHPAWDFGVVGGLEPWVELPARLRLALRVEGGWLPFNHLVRIDQGGPSTPFNHFSGAASLGLAWSP